MFGAIPFIGAVAASVWSSNKAAKAQTQAAQSAADAQVQANREAIAAEKEMMERNIAFQQSQLAAQRQGFLPYEGAGKRALMDYEYLVSGRSPYAQDYADPVGALNRARISELTAELARAQAPTSSAPPAAPVSVAAAAPAAAPGIAGATPAADLRMVPPLWQGITSKVVSGTATPEEIALYNQFKHMLPASVTAAAAGAAPSAPVASAPAASGARTPEEIRRELNALAAETPGADMSEYVAAWQKPTIEGTPLYRFRQEEQQTAIDRALRARGLYNSGYGLKTQATAERALSAEETDKQIGRLADMMKVGVGAAGAMQSGSRAAAGNIGSALQNTAGSVGTALQNMGTARGQAALIGGAGQASSYLNMGSALTGLAQSYAQPRAATTVAAPATASAGTPSLNPYLSTMGMPGNAMIYALTPTPIRSR